MSVPGARLHARAAHRRGHHAPVALSRALVGLGLALALLGCSSGGYTPPTSGPVGTVSVASSCLTRSARFWVRINRQRTETYGCNQTASWPVAAGPVALEVQVEESQYRVEPLVLDFELGEGECAGFLLRQRDGYDLEFFGVEPCTD